MACHSACKAGRPAARSACRTRRAACCGRTRENGAGILYAKDHPSRVDYFWDTEGHGVKIGTITDYAGKPFPVSKVSTTS